MIHPYVSDTYMTALAGMQKWLRLPALGAAALLRRIPGTNHVDAAGPYPFTPLTLPNTASDPFSELRAAGAVSAVFVSDALNSDTAWLDSRFDLARPYKTHYVIDRKLSAPTFSRHHRYEIRRALRNCEVHDFPLREHLDAWIRLYDVLVKKHGLSGLHAFPPRYFEGIAAMPELRAVGAFDGKTLLSCHLWICHGNRAYSHLAASSEAGYNCGAAYAVNAHAIDTFSSCELIDLGGVPDAPGDASDGLRRFKAGFANAKRTNRLCGKILREDVYADLAAKRADNAPANYFPRYRA